VHDQPVAVEATGDEAKIKSAMQKAAPRNQCSGCQTSKSRNPLFSTASPVRMFSAGIGTRLTNSWIGTVPSRGCSSARRWSSGTECIWKPKSHEAADCGLLSADLAAVIRRVKGVKKLGVRLGNWLTAEQGQALWQAPDCGQIKGKRDRALLALLLACGLRRHELAVLTVGHLQQREGIGRSWTYAGRLATFEPFPYQIGCIAWWMTGRPRPKSKSAVSFGA
jgi:hypothetical protein